MVGRPAGQRPSEHRGPYGGDNERGCWLWTGGTTYNAGRTMEYGKATLEGATVRVHRAVYEAVTGRPAPDVIRHTCDNSLCYRPCHLIGGTQVENQGDMVARQRQSKGEDRHNARLTEDAVRKIRFAHARLLDDLADEYGIARITVQAVIAKRNWKEVA